MGNGASDHGAIPPSGGVRWFTRRAVGLHLTSIAVIGGCGFAFWWQLHRALDGNDLSWAYTFEWPLFAGLAVVIWWQQIHESPDRIARRRARQSRADRATADDQPEPPDGTPLWESSEDDPDMAAYNRYLAGLSAAGRRKSWRSS